MAAHPEDHEGDHHDRDRGDDRLEPFLLLLRQLTVEDLQSDGDPGAERHGGGDTDPHQPKRIVPALLPQERGDDADDQGRFDPFAEADYEGREHRSPRRSNLM